MITTTQDDLDKNTTFVLHDDTDLGTVLDEHGVIKGRGRYAAWSQKGATRRDGIVGFFNTKAEAVDAIVKAHGIKADPTPRHLMTHTGVVHLSGRRARGIAGGLAPKCCASNAALSRYHFLVPTEQPVTCKRCA
ncbi:hypothetical protein ACFQ6B_23710 [Streptomyces wedmorensis]|uniref:Uncharacterized protein n=1 Tax=Streptomyces wedmorensis TaxID=43759 RepID=A0ABW6J6G0_STRWE